LKEPVPSRPSCPLVLVLVAVFALHTTDLYGVLQYVKDTYCEEAQPLLLVRVEARVKRDAVRNAITERWSNGQTEGQINRLKLSSGACTVGPGRNFCARACCRCSLPSITENEAEPS
jgi:hypothetical protein